MVSFFGVGKRFLDISLAGVLLVLLFVPFIFITGVSLLVQGYPVFFFQRRAGLYGKVFRIWKLRTMDGQPGSEESDESRITSWGWILRKFKIDELPQLINVLKGEMSLVGPRPLPLGYEENLDHRHLARYQVRPGMTGLAQVKGGNTISWHRRFELDLFYVDKKSFSLDVRILADTIPAILGYEAVVSPTLTPSYNQVSQSDDRSPVSIQPFPVGKRGEAEPCSVEA